MNSNVKFPNVKVKLIGEDGNAIAIMARVTRAMRKANCPAEDIKAYTEACMSSDYNNLLRVTMQTVSAR
jgi:hypothetical protein